MPAIGFGQRVTGAGPNPQRIPVINGDASGAGSLANALSRARTVPPENTGSLIEINDNLRIRAAAQRINVRASNLTIRGGRGSKILTNLLQFDCALSDNVIMENLSFEGDPADRTKLRDTIKLDARAGRGEIGFWIDHCTFEAYYDLNFTSNAQDPPAGTTMKPLLITISNCYFHNDNPGGEHRENNGAIGIHGSTDDDTGTANTQTNAYATICNNFFDHVRRRSPRSSGLCVVHAFNNVLVQWGAPGRDPVQVNGMESGNDGRLVAEANFFAAGNIKPTIHVSTEAATPGRLTINDADTNTLKNRYKDDAVPKAQVPPVIDIAAAYTTLVPALTAPTVEAMTDDKKEAVKRGAGVPS